MCRLQQGLPVASIFQFYSSFVLPLLQQVQLWNVGADAVAAEGVLRFFDCVNFFRIFLGGCHLPASDLPAVDGNGRPAKVFTKSLL